MQRAEPGEFIGSLIVDRCREPHLDSSVEQARDRIEHIGVILRPPERVVTHRLIRVERDLQGALEVGERREAGQQTVSKKRRVRQGDRRQDLGDPAERVGEIREHEHLAACDPDRCEAQLFRFTHHAHHHLLRQRSPCVDPRRGLRQAVRALEVAVVGRVQPEPIAHPPLGCRGCDCVFHESIPGGGMAKAVQY